MSVASMPKGESTDDGCNDCPLVIERKNYRMSLIDQSSYRGNLAIKLSNLIE